MRTSCQNTCYPASMNKPHPSFSINTIPKYSTIHKSANKALLVEACFTHDNWMFAQLGKPKERKFSKKGSR